MTDDQADVAIAAGLRKERTAEYLEKKTGNPLEETHKMALELADIGVFRVNRDKNGTDRFYMQIFSPGIMEMILHI